MRNFIQAHPDHELSGNAQYWLGETYYVRKNYEDAVVAYLEGYQKYPKNQKAPDNLLKLGMSLANLGKKQEACATFTQLRQKFPKAPLDHSQNSGKPAQKAWLLRPGTTAARRPSMLTNPALCSMPPALSAPRPMSRSLCPAAQTVWLCACWRAIGPLPAAAGSRR